MLKQKKGTFEERLNNHPELKNRMEQIINLVEDSGNTNANAHKVEEIAIEQLRELGNEVLSDWATFQSVKKTCEFTEKEENIAKKSKKKFGGIQRTGK